MGVDNLFFYCGMRSFNTLKETSGCCYYVLNATLKIYKNWKLSLLSLTLFSGDILRHLRNLMFKKVWFFLFKSICSSSFYYDFLNMIKDLPFFANFLEVQSSVRSMNISIKVLEVSWLLKNLKTDSLNQGFEKFLIHNWTQIKKNIIMASLFKHNLVILPSVLVWETFSKVKTQLKHNIWKKKEQAFKSHEKALTKVRDVYKNHEQI